MYCMSVCDTQKTLYGVPLEPLPDPALFDDCGEEACGSETPVPGGPTGRGCLFDEFDPDAFDKPCCKSGCCSVCGKIGDDAPYLVPHVVSCMNPWAYAANSCQGVGHGRCKNHRIRVRINRLPSCSCQPTNNITPIPGTTADQDYCNATTNSLLCCVSPQNGARGYQALCIRVRGVPTIEYDDPYANTPGNMPAYKNDPNSYFLYARITLHLEILLKDCCGYLFTIKTSYRLPNSMLLEFPLHCKLCALGEANIYLKTKIQLCEGEHIIWPDREYMFDFIVNLSVDACIIKHIPYDACGSAYACLPSLVSGANNNVSNPEDAMALDTPYMVPFPVACRRFRRSQTMINSDHGTPIYQCTPNATITVPASLPGVGPWTVIGVGSSGRTDVAFNDCISRSPCPPPCPAEPICANVPCESEAACNARYAANCSSHTLEVTLGTHIILTIRDSLEDVYYVEGAINAVDGTTAFTNGRFDINLGTAWFNICRAWLYVKSRFNLCGDFEITGPGAVRVALDILVEACVMKLIPYQITGKDPHCNLGPWYYKNYCKYPIRPPYPNPYIRTLEADDPGPDADTDVTVNIDPDASELECGPAFESAARRADSAAEVAARRADAAAATAAKRANTAAEIASRRAETAVPAESIPAYARPIRNAIPQGCVKNRR